MLEGTSPTASSIAGDACCSRGGCSAGWRCHAGALLSREHTASPWRCSTSPSREQPLPSGLLLGEGCGLRLDMGRRAVESRP